MATSSKQRKVAEEMQKKSGLLEYFCVEFK
jgi:hypothetical protein